MADRFIDLNADLGEDGPADADLLELVSSASIACGFHAGSPSTMVSTARAAAARGVAIGAHPSYYDRAGFGRRAVDMGADELFATVLYQLGAMTAAAHAAGTSLQFVKPHGALYNRASHDPDVAGPVVRAVVESGLPLLCPAGSRLDEAAQRAAVITYSEGFADRAYTPDGSLVPRSELGALIHDPDEAGARAVDLAVRGVVTAIDGKEISVSAQSICIHGDTPEALDIARSVRASLAAAGVHVRAFVQ